METESGQRARRTLRPRWSLRTAFVAAILILTAAATLVLGVMRRSLWRELEVVAMTVSGFMAVFFFVVLYVGVRFDKRERLVIDWPRRPELGAIEPRGLDTGGALTQAGAEAGPGGFVLGVVLDILLSIALSVVIVVLFWLGVTLMLLAIVAIVLPLFFLFSRALRYVFAKGRACRGDPGRSAWHAARATLLYSAWFYAILRAADFVRTWR